MFFFQIKMAVSNYLKQQQWGFKKAWDDLVWSVPANCSDSVIPVNDSTRVTLRNDGDSTRVTFFTEWLDSSLKQWLMTKSESSLQTFQASDWQTQFVCTQNMSFFASVMIDIGANFLFWVCRHSGVMHHGGKAETLLFTEGPGPAGHNTSNTCWRFNVVFSYCDHGNRHILSHIYYNIYYHCSI